MPQAEFEHAIQRTSALGPFLRPRGHWISNDDSNHKNTERSGAVVSPATSRLEVRDLSVFSGHKTRGLLTSSTAGLKPSAYKHAAGKSRNRLLVLTASLSVRFKAKQMWELLPPYLIETQNTSCYLICTWSLKCTGAENSRTEYGCIKHRWHPQFWQRDAFFKTEFVK
jgi:hypothetical protein